MAKLIIFSNDYTQKDVYGKVINYALNPASALYVGSVNIYREAGVDAIAKQMLELTIAYGALGGQLLKHFSLSFDTYGTEAWVTPEIAFSIGTIICQKILYHFQVVFSVHTDTECVHIHFVVNGINYLGEKFVDKQETYMQISNDIKKYSTYAEGVNEKINCDVLFRNNNTYRNKSC